MITEIAATVAAVQNAITISKSIKAALKTMNEAELGLKFAELMESLADAKIGLSDAQQEISDLRRQLREAQERQQYRSLVRLEGNMYVPIGEEIEGYGKGPWCTRCLDTDQKLVILHHKKGQSGFSGSHSWVKYNWHCPSCRSVIPAKGLNRNDG